MLVVTKLASKLIGSDRHLGTLQSSEGQQLDPSRTVRSSPSIRPNIIVHP